MTDEIKLPLIQSLNRLAMGKAADAIQLTGRALPCTIAVIVSSGIVTVNFEVNAAPFTLPQVTVPLGHPEYIRYPIKVGDKGWVAPAAVRLGGVTGLGGGTANLVQPANLSALVFYWLGNTNWSEPDDPNAVVAYGPSGTIIRDTNKLGVVTTAPAGISMESPAVSATGNAVIGTGVTTSFSTPTGQTATLMNGVIVNMPFVGGSPINPVYFANIIQQTTNLVTQLNYFKNNGFGQDVVQGVEAQVQKELQALTNQIIPALLGLLNAVTRQTALLESAVALVTLPVVDLASAIAFITGFQAEVLTLQIAGPYASLISQAAELATQLSSLTSSINSTSEQIGGNVSIPGSPSVQQGESVGVVFEVTRA